MLVPTAPQRGIVDAVLKGGRHCVVYGTVGSGKSSWALRTILDRATFTDSDTDFLFMARRLHQIEHPVYTEVRGWCRERGLDPEVVRGKDFELPSAVGPNNRFHSMLFGVGADKVKQDLQGKQFKTVYVDEGMNMPWLAVSELRRRMRTPGFKTVWTLNPDAPPFHPFKRKFIDQIRDGELDGTVHHICDETNPGVDPEYYAEMRKSSDPLEIIRYLDGEFAGTTLLVYGPAWQLFPRGNLVTEMPADEEIDCLFAGIDYAPGGTNAAVLIARTVAGNYYVIDEWRHYHPDDGDMHDFEKARAMYNQFSRHGHVERWYGDKSNAHGVVLALREFHGQEAYLTSDQPNKDMLDVQIGCGRVRRMFELERLFVVAHPTYDEGCYHTRNEMGMYRIDPDDPEGNPIKEDDHFMDALRYAMVFVPTESVTPREDRRVELAGV